MTAGDLQVAIDVNTRDEVGRLAESFQTMAATLDARLTAERADKQALEDTVSDYVAFVERVAAGNLAIRLGLNGRPNDGDSQADLYRLGEYLNSMVENLAEMAGQIRETVDSITPAVTGIQAVMTQTTATTTEQNAAITQTAATVEQVRATRRTDLAARPRRHGDFAGVVERLADRHEH
ncbi:HAMP domain-containing protein, partial [bacterium]|nr:HAMP domain-containing protein [bacterium]